MDISSINSTGLAGTASPFQSSSLGQEDFLNLLVAQLKNQDPLSPMESQQFAAELAQFSSLERLVSIDGRLEESIGTDLIVAQSINNTLAATLLGREVVALGDSLALEGDGDIEVAFRLGDFAENTTVTISDAAGNTVRTLEVSSLSSGQQRINWDGKDNNGNRLPEGTYSFQVDAQDKSGDKIAATPLVVGTISSVRYENGGAILMINGREVAFSSVLEIGTNG